MTDSTDPAGVETPPDEPASKRSDTANSTDKADRADTPRPERSDQDHLRDVDDGCGCAEVWEHLSAQRDRNRKENNDDTAETRDE